MLSNDILRSLRYTLKVNNNDMVRLLALSAMESTAASFDTGRRKRMKRALFAARTLSCRVSLMALSMTSAAKMIRPRSWRWSVG